MRHRLLIIHLGKARVWRALADQVLLRLVWSQWLGLHRDCLAKTLTVLDSTGFGAWKGVGCCAGLPAFVDGLVRISDPLAKDTSRGREDLSQHTSLVLRR